MEDIKLRITRGKDQELYLTTKTMNEMVEKIIEWQLWENQALNFYKEKGNGRLEKEKQSGWYYFKL